MTIGLKLPKMWFEKGLKDRHGWCGGAVENGNIPVIKAKIQMFDTSNEKDIFPLPNDISESEKKQKLKKLFAKKEYFNFYISIVHISQLIIYLVI